MRDVTNATFDHEVFGSNVPVVVDFWAEWCGPCKALLPQLEDLEEDYGAAVKFIKINVDEEKDLAAEFGIRSIPTLYVIHEEEIAGTIIGGNIPALKELLADLT